MQVKLESHQSKRKSELNSGSNLIQLNPLNRFGHYFDVERGITAIEAPQMCDEIYRLRHKIYCEKLKYETLNEQGIEKDAFDYRSQHVAITHQKLNKIVGCTRVVNCFSKDDKLPMELLSIKQLQDSDFHPNKLLRSSICEISRLAIDQDFKHELSNVTTLEQSLYPLVVIHLYYSSLKLAAESNRPHVYLLSESRLIRSMRLAGINIKIIGDYVAHKGLRKPCYINAQEFIENIPPKFVPLLQNDYEKSAIQQLSAVSA
jgi:N-acyl amino acid synthase of PEP-CTERM/exosortase system